MRTSTAAILSLPVQVFELPYQMADRFWGGTGLVIPVHLSHSFEHTMPHACVVGAMYFAACRFMAFDKHLNMVLGDSEELRKLPPKKGQDEVTFIGQCLPDHVFVIII